MAHDHTELRPCRFCGKADLLEVHPNYGAWLVYDGDALARDARGEVVEEMYSAVECASCCVAVPLPVWQADGYYFNDAQRAAYAAYFAAPSEAAA
jgi:hypothetical protein